MTKHERLKLGKLKAQAERLMRLRGHATPETWEAGNILTCPKCKADVQVILKPLPNEIDIGGRAIAVGCKN